MALAVCSRARHDGGGAVGVNGDLGVLLSGSAGGDLDVARHSDTELPAVAACAAVGLFGAQRVVVGSRCGGVEGGGVRPRVVDVAGWCGVREHVVGQQVAAAQFDWVDTELVGCLIHQTFDERSCLGTPCSPVCTNRGGGGEGHGHIALVGGNCVVTGPHASGSTRKCRADPRVSACVTDDVKAETGKAAIGVEASFGVLHLPASVGQLQQVFTAPWRPHHRHTETLGSDRGHHVGDMEASFTTEPTAYLRRAYPDVVRCHLECRSHLSVQEVRHLRGRPQREVVAIPFGKTPVGLHRYDCYTLVHVATAHHRG